MTPPHLVDDEQALVAYLYDECDADERRRIEQHLAECARCASEVREVRSVREALAGWTPPAVSLGFRVVADPPRRARWWAAGPLPVWAQAAAAVCLFAAGAAVSQLDVRVGGGAVTIGTRWGRPAEQAAPAVPRVAPAALARAAGAAPAATRPVAGSPQAARVSAAASAGEVQRQDPAASAGRGSGGAEPDDSALLRRVQAMIEQSERRQQRELALRLAQVVRDFDVQRRADLLRVDRNLGEIEGQTGAAVAEQRELLNYLVRVSQRP